MQGETMFNTKLAKAVENFAAVTLPLTEKDLELGWTWKDHDEEGIRFAFFVTIQELRQLAVELASLRTPPTSAQSILGQYHAQYMDLQAAIFGLSTETTERAPTEGEWSIPRAYAHILATDIGFTSVIRYALEKHRAGLWTPERMSDEDRMRIVGMTGDEYDLLMGSSLEELVAFHREFHQKILAEFHSITAAELDLPSTFWEDTRFPIRHRLHRFETHMIQHTVQIDKTLMAINWPPSETKRLIRYVFTALAAVEANLIGADSLQEKCWKLAENISSRAAEIEANVQSGNKETKIAE
jgi:hypothetical protein